jgi:hypothetical protein
VREEEGHIHGGGPDRRQGDSGARSGLKASAERGGSSRARWSGARQSGVEKKPKGRRGSGGLSSGRRRAARARGGSSVRSEGGSGKTWGRWA